MTAPTPWRLVAAGIHTLADEMRDPPRASVTGAAPAAPRALVVAGDRILWAGSDPRGGPATAHAVDLGGAWITPGFVDAHVHATATGLAQTGLDLSGCASAAEVLARLRAHAAVHDDGVVLGGPWDDFGWPEGGPPSAQELAAAAPGRTVLLTRVDAHACLVDPATLARLPLPQLEGVDRDREGNPTGLLRERSSEAAQTLVRDLLPSSQTRQARQRACARAAELGITSIHEMGHPGLSGLEDAIAWRDGNWPIDVQVWWAELDAQAGPSRGLRPGGDLFLDGSIGSGTAAVTTPYADTGGAGELFHEDERVRDFFVACTRAGHGAGVHAIGGRAIEQALRAIECAAAAHGEAAVRSCRHRIEHVELPARSQVRRMAALGVVASVQPAFDAVWGGDAGFYAARFGLTTAGESNPIGWFLEDGVPLCFGSDSTVTPLDPWGAVLAAERHQGGLGVARRSALRAHVLGGRHVAGQDDVGPLAGGFLADLAVWDADPMAAADPRGLRCLATLVAGRWVHGRPVAEPSRTGAGA